MKKILFLIFGLISFSASADMELLWDQTKMYIKTEAWCIFEDENSRSGSTYLYTHHREMDTRELIVQPLLNADTNKVQRCYRPSAID